MVKNVGLKTVTVSHVQSKTVTGWKRDGNGMETGWKRDGNGTVTVTGQNQKKYCKLMMKFNQKLQNVSLALNVVF